MIQEPKQISRPRIKSEPNLILRTKSKPKPKPISRSRIKSEPKPITRPKNNQYQYQDKQKNLKKTITN